MKFSRTIRRSTQGLVASLAAGMLLFAAVAPAFAQDSIGEGYRDQGGQVQEQVSGVGGANGGQSAGGNNSAPTETTTADRGDNTLPFTGLEVALILTTGVALAGLGLGLRRVSRQTV